MFLLIVSPVVHCLIILDDCHGNEAGEQHQIPKKSYKKKQNHQTALHFEGRTIDNVVGPLLASSLPAQVLHVMKFFAAVSRFEH
jgi:hypothetical protein